MSEKRNQVNVRLSDDENEELTQVSNSLGISKSEVIRLSLADNLKNATEHKTLMSVEERQQIMRELAGVMSELDETRNEVNKVGVNVNQIAKKFNRKKKNDFTYEAFEFEKGFYRMENELHEIVRRVLELWRLLV